MFARTNIGPSIVRRNAIAYHRHERFVAVIPDATYTPLINMWTLGGTQTLNLGSHYRVRFLFCLTHVCDPEILTVEKLKKKHNF